MKKIIFNSLMLLTVLTSCHNQDWEFPDSENQTVYFAYQYPVRTITLGDDVFDTSLDNQFKCMIMATTGGAYENKKNITIGVGIDNSLCDGLKFKNGDPLLPMPGSYYSVASNEIVISKGSLIGGVEVQLTDAFFADPMALKTTYVIPVKMTEVQNADSILSGVANVENPRSAIASDWSIAPKDYILYAVKYVNPWHGYYLRRGKDVITGKNGNTALDKTIIRHAQYVEKDELNAITTRALSETEFPLVFKDSGGNNINCTLLLNFGEDGNCKISSATSGITASGTGQFVKKGEKKSWGNKDRDAVYLSYEIDLNEVRVTSNDTLVLRNRGVSMETFTPVLK